MEKNIVMTLPKDFNKVKEVEITLANGIDVTVEVIEVLPMQDKVKVIEEIVNACVLNKFNYFNPLFLRTLAQVKTIEACTNIECNVKDLYGFHDILRVNGILDKILPMTDYQEIVNWSYECAESLCKYKNSFVGMMQGMEASKDAEEMMKQITEMAEQIKTDPEIKQFMDEVSPHLV